MASLGSGPIRSFTKRSSPTAARAWLRLYLRAMYDHSRRYRMLSLKTKPFPRSQSAAEHRLILDAAIGRDAEKASRLLADHILKAAQLAEPSSAR